MKLTITVIALALAAMAGPGFAASHAASAPMGNCEKMAGEKKLAGAAKTSFVKKCEADAAAGGATAAASPACEKSAADKNLAGAAKTSHIKKCMADASAKK
jgi:hypothetical protein